MTVTQVIAFAAQVEQYAEELQAQAHALVLLARQLQEMHAPKEPHAEATD